MKKIALLLVLIISLQSCFSTRYVNQESKIKQRYVGATVDDVEMDLGVPHDRMRTANGQIYVYLTHGRDENGKGGIRSTKISFDENGVVRNVRSDVTKEGKKFSAGKTVGAVLGGIAGVIALTWGGSVLLINSASK